MKRTAGSLVSLLFMVLMAPLSLPVRWTRKLDPKDYIFQFGSHCVSLIPGLPGVYARRAYYTAVLPRCGKDVVVEFGTIFAQRDTEIGSRVYIGAFCNVGMCRIDDNVLVGSNVDLISGRHVHFSEDPEQPIRDQGGLFEKISVGEGSWLGNRSVVMADVGRHAIVGAGAVLVHACDDYSVNAGNPAREIRNRLEDADRSPEQPFRRAQSA